MKEENFPHTRKPLHWRGPGWTGGGSFGATEENAATGVRRAKWRDSCTKDQGQPALTSLRGLSAHPPGGWGLGAKARASEVRSQGGDWGWLREHSLKGASVPQLGRRESRKKCGPAERQETFVLGCARRGDSFPVCAQKAEHRLSKLQRQA